MAYVDREQQAAYQRAWMQRRREAFFADKACESCGATDRLELHHRDPAQKVSHRIWSWTEERQREEIAKCEVLCKSCHAWRCKLGPRQKLTLSLIADRGPLSFVELQFALGPYAGQTYRKCSDVREIVYSLRKRGLLERRDADGRYYLLTRLHPEMMEVEA